MIRKIELKTKLHWFSHLGEDYGPRCGKHSLSVGLWKLNVIFASNINSCHAPFRIDVKNYTYYNMFQI